MVLQCDFTGDSSILAQFILLVVVDGCGLLLTFISIPLLLLINGIDSSLRQILVSFQLANLVGIAVISHDTLVTICGDDCLDLTTIPILLILGHIITLLAAEYCITTSSSMKGTNERFEALILVCWLLSIIIGLLCGHLPNGEHRHVAHVIMSICVLSTFAAVVIVYVYVIRHHYWLQHCLNVARNTQVDPKHRKNLPPKVYEELEYVPLVYTSFIVCTFPWIVQMMYEGLNATKPSRYVKFTSLLMFTISFYLPALVPFRMWLKARIRSVGPYEDESAKEDASDYYSAIMTRRGTLFNEAMGRDARNVFSYSYAHQ